MGLVARSATKKLVAPMRVPVGKWLDGSTLPVDRETLVAWAVTAAAMSTPVSTTSSWFDGEGKVGIGTTATTTLSSVVRVREAERTVNVDLGCPSPSGQFAPDWQLEVAESGGSATLTVTGFRTIDDEVPNKKLLDAIRSAIVGVFATGPQLVVTDELDLSGLVEQRVLSGRSGAQLSSFAHDFWVPLPSTFADGWAIALPGASTGQVLAALDGVLRPLTDGRAGVDLGAGRGRGAALVVVDDDDVRLELQWPTADNESATARQRTFRLASHVLRRLAAGLDGDPELGARVTAAHSDWVAASLDEQRATSFEPAWSPDVATDVVPLDGARHGLPVALLWEADPDLSARIIAAQYVVAVRHRQWTRGFTRRAQEENRFLFTRRPSLLKVDGKTKAVVRYGFGRSPDPSAYSTTDGSTAWFWEASSRVTSKGATQMIVSGLAQADGVLAYGPDLLALLRACPWLLADVAPAPRVVRLAW